MREVKAIVPAAGLSTRFGGPNKLLQPFGEGTIVGSVVQTLIDCSLDVVVVTGRDADLVAAAVGRAKTVFNPRFAEGLGTSIAIGVDACGEAEGFLIALGDMPGLRDGVIHTLLAAFGGAPADAILAPVYSSEPERPGHPVLFGAAYREALVSLTGDEGARSIMQGSRAKLVLVRVDGALEDFDQPTPLG